MKPPVPRAREHRSPPHRPAAAGTRGRPGIRAAEGRPPTGRRQVADSHELAIESGLSVDLEIAADELNAIARLLGDDLKIFLSQA